MGSNNKKIGYLCPFGNKPMAETETRIRFQYVVEKLGHQFIPLDINNKTFDSKILADNLDLDYIYSHDTGTMSEYPIPDHFSFFMHWSPSGYLVPSGLKDYFRNMYKYDDVIGGYESDLIKKDCLNNDCKNASFFNITSSVPLDFVIKPEKKDNYRLFYVGINLEKIQKGKTRYGKLIKALDKKNLIDIYGPNKLFGKKNLWGEYENYKGEIPFDGKDILSKINASGICLALNSPVHNDNHTVSNRTYEAAAAGAIIISDDNPYVRKYFGDSVFYLDINLTEDEQIAKILDILEYIQENPNKAYEMACEAQRIFIENLTLDQQVKKLINFCEERKKELTNIKKQNYLIDLICYADTLEDWSAIKREIDKQYYKNLNIILITSQNVKAQITDDEYGTFICADNYRGKSFYESLKHLKGEAFLFLDKYSAMHKNHILKLAESLFARDNLFVYTGTYIRKYNDNNEIINYEPINNNKISQQDFLAFNYFDDKNIYDIFEIEHKFSLNCALFRTQIIQFISFDEITQISNSVHMYLALCSIIKAGKIGRYLSTVSSGYKLKTTEDIYDTVFSFRKYFYEYKRTHIITQKEMFTVFHKYDFETEKVKENFLGYKKDFYRIIRKLRKDVGLFNKIRQRYKDFPSVYKTQEVFDYLKKHMILRFLLSLCIIL